MFTKMSLEEAERQLILEESTDRSVAIGWTEDRLYEHIFDVVETVRVGKPLYLVVL